MQTKHNTIKHGYLKEFSSELGQMIALKIRSTLSPSGQSSHLIGRHSQNQNSLQDLLLPLILLHLSSPANFPLTQYNTYLNGQMKPSLCLFLYYSNKPPTASYLCALSYVSTFYFGYVCVYEYMHVQNNI